MTPPALRISCCEALAETTLVGAALATAAMVTKGACLLLAETTIEPAVEIELLLQLTMTAVVVVAADDAAEGLGKS